MNNLDKTVRDFKKALSNSGKHSTSPYDTQAVVKRIDGDIAWVHIPGGVDETPVQLTTNAKKGDIVQVRVSGGRAWLYGNATNPPTDDTKANEVGKKLLKTETEVYETIYHTEKEIYKEIAADRAEVGELIAGKADIDDLTAATARIGSLEAADVTINGKITAAEGRIGTLEANDITINGKITAAEGRIGDLEADHVSVSDFEAEQANIDNLQAATADIDTIRANSAKVQNLTAAQLEADHATIGSLDTNYAKIDLANVNNAWIQNGVVKNAAIGDAQISGVSANKLTAGTIDASNITVTNLNADNITAGTLNGQRIGTGSLSLDKLSEAVYTESEVDDKLDDMQKEIDGAIETYTGTVVPTLNNTPASSWNTTALKDKHVGDIYYVVNNSSDQNGYCYRFTKSGSTYSWVLIKDSDVTAALQRLTEAEGDISGLQQFESTTSSWISNTDTELNSLKSRTTTVETSLGDKVDSSTFNELSQTVDENSASITSLSTTVQSKADSSTVTTLSNTVNSVQQTANSNSSKISSLTTTLGTNADGTTKTGDIMHQVSDVTQDLSGFKTTVSNTYATKTALNDKADADDLDALTTRVSTAESNITQNANEISSKVSQTDFNNLSGRVSTAESTISQQATEIEAKVNKNGVIASINASVEESGGSSVKINADKVNITGVITAINNDSTTTINGGKIDASTLHVNAANIDGSLTVGQMSQSIQDSLEIADNTLVFDTTYEWNNAKTIATFTAHVYKGGVDISQTNYESTDFTWYLKRELSAQEKQQYPDGRIPLGSGYTKAINVSDSGYGAEVIGCFTVPDDSEALATNGDNLTNSNDENLIVRATGDAVRVRDLTVSTMLYSTDKLMVVGGEDEHLVTIETLQDYFNANLDKQVLFDTTANWNAQTTLVSDAHTLYVYTDHQTDSQNRNVAGIKAGDGSAYVVDLPFVDQIATEHIANTTVHITSSERTRWNSAIKCYYTGTENLTFANV